MPGDTREKSLRCRTYRTGIFGRLPGTSRQVQSLYWKTLFCGYFCSAWFIYENQFRSSSSSVCVSGPPSPSSIGSHESVKNLRATGLLPLIWRRDVTVLLSPDSHFWPSREAALCREMTGGIFLGEDGKNLLSEFNQETTLKEHLFKRIWRYFQNLQFRKPFHWTSTDKNRSPCVMWSGLSVIFQCGDRPTNLRGKRALSNCSKHSQFQVVRCNILQYIVAIWMSVVGPRQHLVHYPLWKSIRNVAEMYWTHQELMPLPVNARLGGLPRRIEESCPTLWTLLSYTSRHCNEVQSIKFEWTLPRPSQPIEVNKDIFPRGNCCSYLYLMNWTLVLFDNHYISTTRIQRPSLFCKSAVLGARW